MKDYGCLELFTNRECVSFFIQEPVSGLADIKAKIEHLGLGGATVDLGCGSVDAQPSEGGESDELEKCGQGSAWSRYSTVV